MCAEHALACSLTVCRVIWGATLVFTCAGSLTLLAGSLTLLFRSLHVETGAKVCCVNLCLPLAGIYPHLSRCNAPTNCYSRILKSRIPRYRFVINPIIFKLTTENLELWNPSLSELWSIQLSTFNCAKVLQVTECYVKAMVKAMLKFV